MRENLEHSISQPLLWSNAYPAVDNPPDCTGTALAGVTVAAQAFGYLRERPLARRVRSQGLSLAAMDIDDEHDEATYRERTTALLNQIAQQADDWLSRPEHRHRSLLPHSAEW